MEVRLSASSCLNWLIVWLFAPYLQSRFLLQIQFLLHRMSTPASSSGIQVQGPYKFLGISKCRPGWEWACQTDVQSMLPLLSLTLSLSVSLPHTCCCCWQSQQSGEAKQHAWCVWQRALCTFCRHLVAFKYAEYAVSSGVARWRFLLSTRTKPNAANQL